MKIKHLIIVSLLLAVITMGVVSASEDVAVDDELAASDVTEDSIGEAPVDEVIGQSEDSEPVELDDSSAEIKSSACDDDVLGDPYVNFKDEIEYPSENLVDAYFDDDGNLTVYVDNEVRYNQSVSPGDNKYLNVADLNITSNGIYLISVEFVKGSNVTDLGSKNITVNINWDEYVTVESSIDIMEHYDGVVYIWDDNPYAKGTLTIYIDDDLFFKATLPGDSPEENFYVEDMNFDNVTLGTHTVRAVYMRNDVEKHESIKLVKFTATPIPNLWYTMSPGEKDNFYVEHAKTFTGTATLYLAKWDDTEAEWVKDSEIGTAEFVNGIAVIPFGSLAVGEFHFIANISDCADEYEVTVEVERNTQGMAASISASEITYGEDIVVKLTGGEPYGDAYVRVDYGDDAWIYGMFDEDGNASIEIPKSYLSVGTHQIKVGVNGGGFYSNSFYVTVKEAPTPTPNPNPNPNSNPSSTTTSTPAKQEDIVKLTLKKVKVKKSAKKLVLKATLKINGKAVKGKVIKFKFNKKTYKAKTNKKGVAKVTIKKNVLKKLKKGKKVTYTATYGKVTKKVTVKVKK